MQFLKSVFCGLTLIAICVPAARRPEMTPVHAIFEPGHLESGPFPSDQLTVVDRDQLTGRRIHLPMPDCTILVSECQDVEILNQLDGFNVQPRFSVPFDGPIDLSTVNSRSIFLLRLGPPRAAKAAGWASIRLSGIRPA